MEDGELFDVGPAVAGDAAQATSAPRVQVPVRNQVEYVESDLDSLIPDEHQVRAVWAFVEQADLAGLGLDCAHTPGVPLRFTPG